MDQILTGPMAELLKMGGPGIAIVALLYGYWKKDREISALQNERVKDRSDDVRAMMTALNANTGATNAQTEAFRVWASNFRGRE